MDALTGPTPFFCYNLILIATGLKFLQGSSGVSIKTFLLWFMPLENIHFIRHGRIPEHSAQLPLAAHPAVHNHRNRGGYAPASAQFVPPMAYFAKNRRSVSIPYKIIQKDGYSNPRQFGHIFDYVFQSSCDEQGQRLHQHAVEL